MFKKIFLRKIIMALEADFRISCCQIANLIFLLFHKKNWTGLENKRRRNFLQRMIFVNIENSVNLLFLIFLKTFNGSPKSEKKISWEFKRKKRKKQNTEGNVLQTKYKVIIQKCTSTCLMYCYRNLKIEFWSLIIEKIKKNIGVYVGTNCAYLLNYVCFLSS